MSPSPSGNHMTVQAIAEWLRRRVIAAGARGLTVGLSGGLDSSVVAGICQVAMPGKVVAVLLPCASDPRDEEDARLAADHLQVAAVKIDLEPIHEALVAGARAALAALPEGILGAARDGGDRVPIGNVKARLRMAALYYVANSLDYLVAGTGNRSELTIGYFTKYGDGGVDLLPIGHLLKRDVVALGRDLGLPSSIIDKPPSAGLWLGQTDEEEMGFSYVHLDDYLTRGPDGVPPALGLRVERLIRRSEHKRIPAPIPEADDL